MGNKSEKKGVFKETPDIVESITSANIGRHISSLTDIPYHDAKMIFKYIVDKIMDGMMNGKVVRVEGLGIFFLEVCLNRFVYKHHRYEDCDSAFSIKPCFRPNTYVVSSVTNRFGLGILNVAEKYLPMLHSNKRLQFDILRDSVETADMEAIDARIQLARTKIKQLNQKIKLTEESISFLESIKLGRQ